jgi:hypothetical protein
MSRAPVEIYLSTHLTRFQCENTGRGRITTAKYINK